jgi:hypothetical protein
MTWEPSDYRELIESALAHSGGTHTFDDIAAGIAAQRYQLWPGRKSVVVSEILQFPQRRVAHCFLAAGDMEEIQVQRRWLEGWAASQGCQSVTVAGRPGWERVLAADGYQKAAVLLEKNLEAA